MVNHSSSIWIVLLLSSFVILPGNFTHADCTGEPPLLTLTHPDLVANVLFGRSVGISGNVIVVGSIWDDTGAPDAGRAFVFDATTGALVATLDNPTPNAEEQFGYSAAVSGNLVVVGCPGDNSGAANSGAAYVFDATTGALITTLKSPTPLSGAYFGISVAISGNLVVVGAFGEGIAYVFNPTTGMLITTFKQTGSDSLGHSVAIDGNVAVAGVPSERDGENYPGAAYAFNATTGALITRLGNPEPDNSDAFGESVALSGNVVVVGARGDNGGTNVGAAYVFDASNGALISIIRNPTPQPNDYFGAAVAISGNVAVIGAYGDRGPRYFGRAFAFDAMTGDMIKILKNPENSSVDYMGGSVAVSADTIVVGAYAATVEGKYYSGQVFTFGTAPVTPTPTPTPSPSPDPALTPSPTPCAPDSMHQILTNPGPENSTAMGISVDISGGLVVAGIYNTGNQGPYVPGKIYIFDAHTGAVRATLESPAPFPIVSFGTSVAIDGNLAAITSRGEGLAYVYDATTGNLLSTLEPRGLSFGDYFATDMSISGNVAIVGEGTQGVNPGTVHLFDATTGEITGTLEPPGTGWGEGFGVLVEVSGNFALVSATRKPCGDLSNVGTVYVYDVTTSALLRALISPEPIEEAQFGSSIALSGNLAVISAKAEGVGVQASNWVAYVFDVTTGTHITTLRNPFPESGVNGITIDIDASLAVIGSYTTQNGSAGQGSVYIYDATTGALLSTVTNPRPKPGDTFGASVGISGEMAVVGTYLGNADGAANPESAYTFSCIGPARRSVLTYLLGLSTESMELDANADGTVDIADLLVE